MTIEFHITPSSLSYTSTLLPSDTPVVMLNLLRYRPTAVYHSSASENGSEKQAPSAAATPSTDVGTFTAATSKAISGVEAYGHYREAFGRVCTQTNVKIEPVFIGKAYAQLAKHMRVDGGGNFGTNADVHGGAGAGDGNSDDGDKYDMIALIRYPSFAAFRKVIESEMYKAEAEPHRLAALEGWRIWAMVEL